MRALVNAPSHDDRVALAYVDEPVAGPYEAVVAVAASSLNRGELRLLASRHAGWRPGQDVAGTVIIPASDGSGRLDGKVVLAISEA
jgi:NADPH2:quinone reductase